MTGRLAIVVLAACTSRVQVPHPRFANAPPVELVDDRRDVPARPEPRAPVVNLTQLDGLFLNLIGDTLSVLRPTRARGVNALDEVPDSTWFVNRIGVRALSPDEIRRGPSVAGSPEAHKPWTVRKTKDGGSAIGFVVEDARGIAYLLKFDEPAFPEVETAAGAITNRLVWAAGYNVPEDHVVYLRREDLVLAADATIKDRHGEHPLTRAELDGLLAQIAIGADGRIRGIASRMLDGEWLGGHPARGVREDDPNDRIPHELRRDLRGTYAIFAWLDHVDVKEANTLDMWAEDPEDPARHYVRHYQIDFGKSLGAMALIHRNPRSGYEYAYDLAGMFVRFVTGGIPVRRWEHRGRPPLRGVGLFDAAAFDPGGWKPNTPSYLPLRTADRFDKFWGAKLVIRFTRAQLRAAVDAGRLSDPRAAAYLVDTLVARQRATARYWFARVSPLDEFAVARAAEGGRLCFVDLALRHHLAPGAPTRYAVRTLDWRGRATSPVIVLRPTGPRSCTPPIAVAGYTIARLETRRDGRTLTVDVHLGVAPDGGPRVIGIWRH